MGQLIGRIAIVTGGASGIGAGIAAVLAEAGAAVVVADIDGGKAAEQAAVLRSKGHSAGAVAVDVADEASIVSACAQVIAEFGTPWALINNAGVQDRQLLLEGTVAEWDRTLDINARGPFLMSREVARAMVAGGQGGRIVNIASAAVIGSITTGHAAYGASKTALLGLTRASALELVSHGITVNTVLPGGVLTSGAFGARGPMPEGPALRMPHARCCPVVRAWT